MARRRRRRRTRGVGNIITTRKTSGLGSLGSLKKPGTVLGSLLPPLLGGGLTALATMAITHMAKKGKATAGWGALGEGDPAVDAGANAAAAAGDPAAQTATTHQKLDEYAPIMGIALGGVGAFFLGSTFGKPAGYAAAAGALGVGGSMLVARLMAHKTAGLGTVVAEYGTAGLGNAGTGAIVMEPNSAQGYNAYSGGASVNISGLAGGLGAGMDVSAFGPSSF